MTTLESKPTLHKMRAKRQWLRDGKNCDILKAKELVVIFLIQPIQMKYMRAIPASIVDLNFNSSN